MNHVEVCAIVPRLPPWAMTPWSPPSTRFQRVNQSHLTPATWHDLDLSGTGEEKALRSNVNKKPTFQLLVSAFSVPDQHVRRPNPRNCPPFQRSRFLFTGYQIWNVDMGARSQSHTGQTSTSRVHAWVRSHVWLRVHVEIVLTMTRKDGRKGGMGVSDVGQWSGGQGVRGVSHLWGWLVRDWAPLAHVNDGGKRIGWCTFSSFHGCKSKSFGGRLDHLRAFAWAVLRLTRLAMANTRLTQKSFWRWMGGPVYSRAWPT